MTEQNVNTKSLVSQDDEFGLPVARMIAQVQRIQEVMRAVMKDGEHYGKIPGCGDKPALLKPGAEKLCLAFRLAPKYEINEIELGSGHMKYETICRLYTIDSERFVGEGVGSCSTMEGKFRYRSENTGKEVPKEYWEHRDSRSLGGYDYSARKVEGKWMIVHRVEHDNPADYYNTCKKMSAKRAQVAATLTATAASDIFTQDIDEIEEDASAAPEPKATIKPPQEKQEKKNGGTHSPIDKASLQYDSMITGVIDAVTKKESGDGFRWAVKLAGSKDWIATFDSKIGEVALVMRDEKIEADLYYKENKGYKNIVLLEAHIAQEAEPQKEKVPF